MKRHMFSPGTAVVWMSAFLFMFGCSKAELTGWKVLQEDSYGNRFYYDAESVRRTSENSVTVWAKSNGAKYLYEIDCKNRKARILNEDDKSSPPQWFDIAGNSGDALVYKAVCQQ